LFFLKKMHFYLFARQEKKTQTHLKPDYKRDMSRKKPIAKRHAMNVRTRDYDRRPLQPEPTKLRSGTNAPRMAGRYCRQTNFKGFPTNSYIVSLAARIVPGIILEHTTFDAIRASIFVVFPDIFRVANQHARDEDRSTVTLCDLRYASNLAN